MIRFTKIHVDAIIPFTRDLLNSGYPLHALHTTTIPPLSTKIIRTGIKVEFPFNVWGKIEERSSLAVCGIHVHGGVINNDFKNEIKIIFYNSNSTSVNIFGECAKLVLYPLIKPNISSVRRLEDMKKMMTSDKGMEWIHEDCKRE